MTATIRKTSPRSATKTHAKPKPDRWGRVNNYATLAIGFAAIGCGLFGTISMTWMYGPRGLLLLAASVDVALVTAVILTARAFRTRRPLFRTAWSLFTAEKLWRWLIVAPLILLGLITVAATPFVIIAELVVVGVFASVTLRELRTVVRRIRA